MILGSSYKGHVKLHPRFDCLLLFKLDRLEGVSGRMFFLEASLKVQDLFLHRVHLCLQHGILVRQLIVMAVASLIVAGAVVIIVSYNGTIRYDYYNY